MYGGESITRNITIKTDGDYLVYLSHRIIDNVNSTRGLYVDYKSPIQVNGEKVISINISAFYIDSFTIQLFASTEDMEKVEPEIIYRTSSRKTRYIYVDNKTIEYVDNKTIEYVDRIIDLTKDPVPTEEEITIGVSEEPEKSYWYYYLAIFVIVAIIIYLFYRTSFKESEEKVIDEDTIEKEV